MKYISKTNYNTSKSDSLRTTIPKEIVEKLGLNNGDNLIWIFEEDNPDSVIVKKLEL